MRLGIFIQRCWKLLWSSHLEEAPAKLDILNHTRGIVLFFFLKKKNIMWSSYQANVWIYCLAPSPPLWVSHVPWMCSSGKKTPCWFWMVSAWRDAFLACVGRKGNHDLESQARIPVKTFTQLRPRISPACWKKQMELWSSAKVSNAKAGTPGGFRRRAWGLLGFLSTTHPHAWLVQKSVWLKTHL